MKPQDKINAKVRDYHDRNQIDPSEVIERRRSVTADLMDRLPEYGDKRLYLRPKKRDISQIVI
jgi:hypothetical protein